MTRLHTLAPIALAVVAASCERTDPDGPPLVRLGDSVCARCNMIISDERWATATMVASPRGAEGLLFDDFNCQAQYEKEHEELVIRGRWSHCYATLAWTRTDDAVFLVARAIRSPMGSNVAAFASRPDAADMARRTPGEVLTFDETWRRLGGDVAPAPDASHPTDNTEGEADAS